MSPVRKRPGMYFGDTGPRGAAQVILELFENAIDEFLQGHATSLCIVEEGDSFEVKDDGRGLPFDQPLATQPFNLGTHYLTSLHSSQSADAHAPHVHFRNAGVGLAAVVAVCETVNVQSWRDGKLWEQSFHRGQPLAPAQVVRGGSGRGTTYRVLLDSEIFGSARPCPAILRRSAVLAAHLFRGIRVQLNRESFCAPQGLLDLAFLLPPMTCRDPWAPAAEPFHGYQANDVLSAEVVAFGDGSGGSPDVRSWVNGGPTEEHGSHVDGLKDALRRSRWRPSFILLHVIMRKPEFAGPTRGRLVTPIARKEVRELLAGAIAAHCQKNQLGRFVAPPQTHF